MKKFMTLLLALAMVLSLAACGGGDKPAGDAGDSAPAGTSDPADSSAPADSGTDAPAFTTVEEGKLHMSTNTAVQTGQSDIAMAGITVTEDRQQVMDFSDSYATGIQVVIVKEDSPIATLDDLSNAQMIGCQKATTGYIYCSDTPENGGYGEDHVTAYETGALAVMALVNGQVDAVVIDNEPAKSFVASNDGLKILDTEFAVEDYAIGFAKGNTALLEAVNAAMAELKADGTFQGIVDKYITAE